MKFIAGICDRFFLLISRDTDKSTNTDFHFDKSIKMVSSHRRKTQQH